MEYTTFDTAGPITVPGAGAITKVVATVTQNELATTFTVMVNDVASGSFNVPVNPCPTGPKTYTLNSRIEVPEGSIISIASTAAVRTPQYVSVTKFPTPGWENWHWWQFGAQIPSWFSKTVSRRKSNVVMYASADPSVFVHGEVRAWESKTKKYRIHLLTPLPKDISRFNSWHMMLDAAMEDLEGDAATLESVSIDYEYEPAVDVPEPEPEPDPQTPPSNVRKRRRIMM